MEELCPSRVQREMNRTRGSLEGTVGSILDFIGRSKTERLIELCCAFSVSIYPSGVFLFSIHQSKKYDSFQKLL